MGIEKGIFKRTELLLGNKLMDKIGGTRVIIFGIGGVGSWCAESLVRSGIKHITVVDSDRICLTNVNRQLMATMQTVGQVKVEALKKRLLEINPKAEITAVQQIYDENTAGTFQIASYDYIIDAIDSLTNKAHLISEACKTDAVLFSSMGAALKMDPSKIQVAEFWDVKGCPLAAALRRKFKKSEKPARKFQCVYSDELLQNKGVNSSCGSEKCLCPKSKEAPGNPDLATHEWCSTKAQINGTVAHITAIFGFTLAGLVMQNIGKNF
jgi:tRNA A37 threonylcarbamoyladenosine dehydratase